MKEKAYEGKLKNFSSTNIYININDLEKGTYVLKIINKNKIIVTTKFNKK